MITRMYQYLLALFYWFTGKNSGSATKEDYIDRGVAFKNARLKDDIVRMNWKSIGVSN